MSRGLLVLLCTYNLNIRVGRITTGSCVSVKPVRLTCLYWSSCPTHPQLHSAQPVLSACRSSYRCSIYKLQGLLNKIVHTEIVKIKILRIHWKKGFFLFFLKDNFRRLPVRFFFLKSLALVFLHYQRRV